MKPGSNYPTQGSEGASGYDVMAAHAVAVLACQIRVVDLNLACQLPKKYFMQLCNRSGLAKRGIIVIAGIIDSDYTGSIKALIYNTTEEEYKVQKGDKIAQALILKHHYGEFEEKELEPTGKGTGAVLVLPEINSYSINYYDCLQTNLIKKYEKTTICQRKKPEETVCFEYNTLQRKKINKLEGYCCSVKSSTFHFKCGALSHLNLSSTPATYRTDVEVYNMETNQWRPINKMNYASFLNALFVLNKRLTVLGGNNAVRSIEYLDENGKWKNSPDSLKKDFFL